MIVYLATKSKFQDDILSNRIEASTTAIDNLESELHCQNTRPNIIRQSTLATTFHDNL